MALFDQFACNGGAHHALMISDENFGGFVHVSGLGLRWVHRSSGGRGGRRSLQRGWRRRVFCCSSGEASSIVVLCHGTAAHDGARACVRALGCSIPGEICAVMVVTVAFNY
jgi:hypothetical protein